MAVALVRRVDEERPDAAIVEGTCEPDDLTVEFTHPGLAAHPEHGRIVGIGDARRVGQHVLPHREADALDVGQVGGGGEAGGHGGSVGGLVDSHGDGVSLPCGSLCHVEHRV